MGLTPALVIDIAELFQKQFGSNPYVVPGVSDTKNVEEPFILNINANKAEKEFTTTGSLIREQYRGVEIFLPIRIYEGDKLLMYLPYCVVRISGKNTYVKTPMIERNGSVKELYSSDDYSISVKGFLISDDRKFPEKELQLLKDAKEKRTPLVLDNALTNIFLTDKSLQLDEQRRVVIEGIELPDVQGGRERVRPFTMQLESDSVFTLELD